MAQRFTADAITPFAAEWDEKHLFPRDVVKAAADLGFCGIYVSEESGGIGLGRLEAAIIMEAMAYGCPSTSAFISIHNMGAWMIDRFGSDDLRAHYVPRLVSADLLAARTSRNRPPDRLAQTSSSQNRRKRAMAASGTRVRCSISAPPPAPEVEGSPRWT